MESSLNHSVASLTTIKPRGYQHPESALARSASLEPTVTRSRSSLKVFLTSCVYFAFFGCGCHVGVIGPTLVHLQHLYNTSMSDLSMTFIGTNIGYFIGTVICGLMFDKFNAELQFSLWILVSGVTVTSLPWMTHLYQFFAVISLLHLSTGVIYSAGQPYLINLWSGTRHQRPILQASYVMYCLGTFIIPFISIPFLDDLTYLDYENKSACSVRTAIHNNTTVLHGERYKMMAECNSSLLTDKNSSSISSISGEVSKVSYVFAIVGAILVSSALCFGVAFFIKRPSCKKPKVTKIKTDQNDIEESTTMSKNNNNDLPPEINACQGNTKMSSRFHILKCTIISIVVVFVSFNQSCFYMIAHYISAFAVEELQWSSANAAILMSVFYGCHCLGALTAVFVSIIVKPSTIITLNQVLIIIGIALLLFGSLYNIDGLIWGSVAEIGAVSAPILPSVFLWLATHFHITSRIGAIFMAATSIGAGLLLPVVGTLFDRFTPMSVVYTGLGVSIASAISMFVMFTCGKMVGNQQSKLQW